MAVLNQAGTTNQRGAVEQYGQGHRNSKIAADSTKITPAGPYVSKGTNDSIIGTVPPGKTGLPQISTVIQDATDPLVAGQQPNNQADNFLASKPSLVTTGPATDQFTAGGGVPAMNAAQDAQVGKSLSPQHE